MGTGGANEVTDAVLQQSFGVVRFPNHRSADHRDVHHLFQLVGQLHLPALVKAGGLPGGVHGLIDAGTDVQQVCSGVLEQFGVLLGQFQGDASFTRQADIVQIFTGRDADGNGEFRPAGIPNAVDDLQSEAGAIGHGAAIVVGAAVGVGAQKLVDKVAVGGVDEHPIHAGFLTADGAIDELLHHAGDLLGSHGNDRLAGQAALDGAGGKHPASAVEGTVPLAARVVQLHKEGTAVGVQDIHELAVARDKLIIVNAQVSGVGTAGVGGYRDGFAHDESCAAFGTGFVEGDVLCAHGAIQIGQGIAHGFHDDTVLHSEGADFTGGTEVWSHKGVLLFIQILASRPAGRMRWGQCCSCAHWAA